MTERSSCAHCEYFDAMGEKRVIAARAGERIAGDCLNNRSPYFTVWSDQGCPEFFADEEAATVITDRVAWETYVQHAAVRIPQLPSLLAQLERVGFGKLRLPHAAWSDDESTFGMTWDSDAEHLEIEIAVPGGSYDWFWMDRVSGRSQGEEACDLNEVPKPLGRFLRLAVTPLRATR